MSGHAEDWEQKCAWMRDRGVTSATWDEGGTLLHCVLGASPLDVSSDPKPEDMGRPVIDRRATALGAVARGVKRVHAE